jgi:hypothetical protein
MLSERRLAAIRANGAKSRGPVTAQGKANSARNNFRHGMRSRMVFPDHTADPAWFPLLAGYCAEFEPQSDHELSLVHTLALADWQTIYLWALEANLINHETDRLTHLHPDDDPADDPDAEMTPRCRVAFAFTNLANNNGVLDRIQRHEARLDRLYIQTLARLQSATHINSTIRTEQVIENTHSRPPAQPSPGPIQTQDQRHTPPARQPSVDPSPAQPSTLTAATATATT